jgi:hypothetical protein
VDPTARFSFASIASVTSTIVLLASCSPAVLTEVVDRADGNGETVYQYSTTLPGGDPLDGDAGLTTDGMVATDGRGARYVIAAG